MPQDKALQDHIANLNNTKAVFQRCERLLKTNTWPGSECAQVSECIQLMKYMVKETSSNVKEILANSKTPKKVEGAAPAPATIASDLGSHIPEAE